MGPSRYTGRVSNTLKEQNVPERRAILALDYGRVRIGLAIADAETQMPLPLRSETRVYPMVHVYSGEPLQPSVPSPAQSPTIKK